MNNLPIEPLVVTGNETAQLNALASQYVELLKEADIDPWTSGVVVPDFLQELYKLKDLIVTFKEVGQGIFPEIDAMWESYLTSLNEMETVLLAIQTKVESFYLSTGTH